MELPPIIRPKDIVHLPILTNPRPSPAFQQTVNWFGAAGLEPRRISVSNSVSVIAHLVEAGIGLAILPRRLVEDKIKDGRLVALRCRPSLEPSLMSAAYRDNIKRPAVDAVVDAAKELLDRLRWLRPL